MIHLTKLFLIMLISIVFKTTMYGQQNTDSIRLVNEALKMIEFPEPEFKSPFVPNLDLMVLDFQDYTSDILLE